MFYRMRHRRQKGLAAFNAACLTYEASKTAHLFPS
jgi:hypothetical protein